MHMEQGQGRPHQAAIRLISYFEMIILLIIRVFAGVMLLLVRYSVDKLFFDNEHPKRPRPSSFFLSRDHF